MRRVCAYPPVTGCAGPPPRFKQRAAALREQSLGTARTLSTRKAGKTSIGPLIFQVLSALADAAARHDYAGIQCHAAPALAPNKAQYIQQLVTSKFSILLINIVFLKSGAAIKAATQARVGSIARSAASCKTCATTLSTGTPVVSICTASGHARSGATARVAS